MTHTNEHNQDILQTLASIPYGKVSTYGGIAARSGNQGKARYIGYILKNLPNSSEIPWHRVINSQGKISFEENSHQYKKQVEQLRNEGVEVINGKINLKQFLWTD